MMTNPAHKAFYCVCAKVNYCQSTAEEESIDKVVLVGRGGGGRIVDNQGHIAVIALITHTDLNLHAEQHSHRHTLNTEHCSTEFHVEY